MFYSNQLLSKRMPLGVVWYAAHGKRLPRGRILHLDISDTCKQILFPDAPLALRLSAVLAKGVVVIYEKQSKFLYEDCEEALRRVIAVTASASEPEAGANTAKVGDITLGAEAAIGQIDLDLFPTFSLPAMSLGGPPNSDDLFLMPSVPEGPHERAARSTGNNVPPPPTQMPDYMEVMEGPGLDLMGPGFDIMMMPGVEEMPGFDAAFMEVAPLPHAPPEEAGHQAGQGTQTPQLVNDGVHKNRMARKSKKAHIDAPEDMQISTADFQFQLKPEGRAELMVERPVQQAASLRVSADLSLVGPATGPWPSALKKMWEASVKLGGGRGNDQDPFEGKDKATKRRRLPNAAADPDAPPSEPLAFPDFFQPAGLPMDDGYNFGQYDAMMGANGDAAGEENAAFPAKLQRAAGSLGSGESLDVEAERLRAALNGTPGGDYRGAMLQLGLTPASGSDRQLSGSRHGRSSAGLRTHSDGGRLSERSSERGREPRRLSEMLDELQAAEGDLGAALPAVGEEEPFLNYISHGISGRTRQGLGLEAGNPSAGLSQFSLLEETAPTQPSAPLACNGQDAYTLGVLSQIMDMSKGPTASLFSVTANLTRRDAARVFSVLLAGHSKGYIRLDQQAPYEDITINFVA